MAVGPKRRNSEKRKEKSRDAARCRRGKEAEIFTDLANLLPLNPSTIEHLDKAAVMRLVLSDLRINAILDKRPKIEPVEDGTLEGRIDTMCSKALEGFCVLLSDEGDIIYITESVAKYIGLQQIDLMGQSIYEFVHPCDHDEIQDMLSPREVTSGVSVTRFVRIKCTLTSKGRNVNLKSATYKVIKLTGKFFADDTGDSLVESEEGVIHMDYEDEVEGRPLRHKNLPYLLAVCETIPHPSNIEVPLDKRTFTSRHSMNMRFTDCDDRISHLIGYEQDELIGQSLYMYHHALDSKMMEKAFKDLFSKGQITTGQYRFMAKNGGYVWMITQATIIYNNRTQKPQCIVCVHYVLSRVEQHGRVMSSAQSPITVKKEETKPRIQCQMPVPNVKNIRVSKKNEGKLAELFHIPTFSTEDVFETKTDDMDQEFYFPPGVKKSRFYYIYLAHCSQPQEVCRWSNTSFQPKFSPRSQSSTPCLDSLLNTQDTDRITPQPDSGFCSPESVQDVEEMDSEETDLLHEICQEFGFELPTPEDLTAENILC